MARVTGGGIPKDVLEADASLIAAAPDLLAACKLVITQDRTRGYPTGAEWMKLQLALRAAIAKAEGESK